MHTQPVVCKVCVCRVLSCRNDVLPSHRNIRPRELKFDVQIWLLIIPDRFRINRIEIGIYVALTGNTRLDSGLLPACIHFQGYGQKISVWSTNWLPHTFNEDHKEFRYEVARRNLAWYRRKKDMLDKLICLDACWIEFYIPLQRHQPF